MLAYLIERGANVCIRNNEPLRLATKNGHIRAVQMLVNAGADIDAEAEEIKRATELGFIDIIRFLQKQSLKDAPETRGKIEKNYKMKDDGPGF